jgi:hypothetical protein
LAAVLTQVDLIDDYVDSAANVLEARIVEARQFWLLDG